MWPNAAARRLARQAEPTHPPFQSVLRRTPLPQTPRPSATEQLRERLVQASERAAFQERQFHESEKRRALYEKAYAQSEQGQEGGQCALCYETWEKLGTSSARYYQHDHDANAKQDMHAVCKTCANRYNKEIGFGKKCPYCQTRAKRRPRHVFIPGLNNPGTKRVYG